MIDESIKSCSTNLIRFPAAIEAKAVLRPTPGATQPFLEK